MKDEVLSCASTPSVSTVEMFGSLRVKEVLEIFILTPSLLQPKYFLDWTVHAKA